MSVIALSGHPCSSPFETSLLPPRDCRRRIVLFVLPHRIGPFTMCKFTFTLLLALLVLVVGSVQASNYTVLYQYTSNDCTGPFYRVSLTPNTTQTPCASSSGCEGSAGRSLQYFCQEYPASLPTGIIVDSFFDDVCADFYETNFFPSGVCGNTIYNQTEISYCQNDMCNVTFVSAPRITCLIF